MKNVLTVTFAILLTAVFFGSGNRVTAAPLADVIAGTVKVTVNYKGKGKVDASHKLWVYVFDTPNIGPGAIPIGQLALDKNGVDAVFDDIAVDKVYIAAAFDESGAMLGDAPPPAGSPIGILTGADGAPVPVTPGAKAASVLNFDDTVRMP